MVDQEVDTAAGTAVVDAHVTDRRNSPSDGVLARVRNGLGELTGALREHRAQEASSFGPRVTDLFAERVAALSHVDFLADLPGDALRDLALGARRKPYAAGELILEQGESGDEFFVIRRGEVAVIVGGHEVVRLPEGGFFGEMSLMTGAPRSATIRAVTPCELVVVNKPSMQEVLQTYPVVVERITAVLARRTTSLQDAAARSGEPSGAPIGQPALVRRIRDFFKLV